MTSFDLITEPWIPCLDFKGRPVELGIRDVLVRAHELRDIDDDSPLVVASLYRFLLAVVHRVVDGPRDLGHKRDLWQKGRFDPKAVEEYLSRWRNCFDLFHPARPFYQVAELASSDLKSDPVTRLSPEKAGGNNATLFDHSVDESPEAVSPAVAVRVCLAYHGYDHGGRIPNESVSQEQGTLRRAALVMLCGSNVFENLLLNTPVYDLEHHKPIPSCNQDRPRWEGQGNLRQEKRAANGWLDLLTWPSRSVLLLREDDGTVARVLVRGGVELDHSDQRDPMFIWRASKKRGFEAVEVRKGRALWRDSAPLFASSTAAERRFIAPVAMNELSRTVESGSIGDFPTRVIGVAAHQAKVWLWREEKLPYPVVFASSPNLGEDVKNALDKADAGMRALRGSVKTLAERLLSSGIGRKKRRSPDPRDIERLAKSLDAESRYWETLGAHFDSLVCSLPRDEDAALDDWIARVRTAAELAFDAAARRAASSILGMRAVAIAQEYFRRKITKALRKKGTES